MKCQGCDKDDDLDENLNIFTFYVESINYRLCEDCVKPVKDSIHRVICVLKEQNGLTLYDNGIPLPAEEEEFHEPPQPNIHVLNDAQFFVWHPREVPLSEAFANQLYKFLCNILDSIHNKLDKLNNFLLTSRRFQ